MYVVFLWPLSTLCHSWCSLYQVMATTRLGQGAKFFRAEDLRDQHGRLQPAPPIVLGPMAPGGTTANPSSLAKLTELAKKPLSVQVGLPTHRPPCRSCIYGQKLFASHLMYWLLVRTVSVVLGGVCLCRKHGRHGMSSLWSSLQATCKCISPWCATQSSPPFPRVLCTAWCARQRRIYSTICLVMCTR